jgi:hypothetical protein
MENSPQTSLDIKDKLPTTFGFIAGFSKERSRFTPVWQLFFTPGLGPGLMTRAIEWIHK